MAKSITKRCQDKAAKLCVFCWIVIRRIGYNCITNVESSVDKYEGFDTSLEVVVECFKECWSPEVSLWRVYLPHSVSTL